jgi:subtilisin family serine protease
MTIENSGYVFRALTNGGETGISPMDPRLQKLVAFGRHGVRKKATASTMRDEVAVLAKVTDLAAWENLSEVRPGAVIGETATDGTTLVTARIPIARIEHVRTQPYVKSLKSAKRLSRRLAKTTEEIRAQPSLLPKGSKAKGGTGAVVGIADIGCDFAHRNFLTSTGKTRLKKLWDQWGTGGGGGGFNYGTVHSSAKINAALKKQDPYTALGYAPTPFDGAHGTHVMDIAAGNGRGSGVPGVAPDARIVFVEVANSDIPWEGPETLGKNFGDSVQLLEALKFIFDTAGAAPCAINVSLGTNGGPHDGSTLVEQGIDRLVRQAPNRAVVIAASNSYADGIHASGTVPQSGQFSLPWIVELGDQTENEMEIWYPKGGRLSLEIFDPQGKSLGSVPAGQSGTVSSGGKVILFAANRLNDPNNGDNMIGIYLSNLAPQGRWTVLLQGDPNQAVDFHAWVERDDYGQASFPEPRDNSHTIGSISCGHDTLVVGSYDAHKASLPLSYFSSAGPTRDGRQKPEVSAPGHAVVAARSGSKKGVTTMSGTSMAAPAVTGTVALMLAEAKARKKSLTIDQIREAAATTARHNPPPGAAWDARYGNGRIYANGLVAGVMGVPPGTSARISKAPAKKVRAVPKTKKKIKTASGKMRTGRKAPAKRGRRR